MWWSIFSVSFTGLRIAWRTGKELFLSVSVRAFPEGIEVWVSGLSREDVPSMQAGTMQSARVLNRIKGDFFFSFFWSWGALFSYSWTSELQAVWLLDSKTYTSGPWALWPWTEFTPLASQFLWTLDFDWAMLPASLGL